MAITEQTIEAERIEILDNGSLQIRDASVILRDGVRDPAFPPKYHRTVLHPGADLDGQPAKVAAVAQAVWTEEVVAAWAACQADAI